MNKLENSQDDTVTEPLVDLEVTTDNADQTKAGTFASGGGHGQGKVNVHDISVTKQNY